METTVQDPIVTQQARTEKLVAEIKAMLKRAEEKTVERAKAADQVIRRHPYESLGLTFAMAFGVGLAIGLLARRK